VLHGDCDVPHLARRQDDPEVDRALEGQRVLAQLKKDGWIEGLGPGSRLEIQVREPSTVHSLTVQQLHRWLDSVTPSPGDVLRRARVKQLLEL
jgi:hypothetical protein